MRIEGIITAAFSDTRGAPVVVNILQDDGTHRSVSFERKNWNGFIDSNPPLFFGQTRVIVLGIDEWNCGIKIAGDDEVTYDGDREDLQGQPFDPESEEGRGIWGYLRPSGAAAVLCGICGEVVLETFEGEETTTEHGCW